MGFIDDVADEVAKGPKCSFTRLHDQDPDLHAEVLDALEQRLSPTAIARALTRRGHEVSDKTVRRHMAEECSVCRS